MPDELKGAKMWVVLPINWEYDDNHYNRMGYDKPDSCFTLKEMADEMAKEKNISDFKAIATEPEFGGYYSYSSYWGNDQSMESLKKLYHISEEASLSEETLSRMSEEDILNLMKNLGILFYKVAELKIYC
ncbi:MAG: hypothetical protein EB127_31650 [Alphaproteobacteria bacterium]|nr:hypothetical protein [Alphaproteobacteria bacterium]